MQRTFSRLTLAMVVVLVGCGIKSNGSDEEFSDDGGGSGGTPGNSSASTEPTSTGDGGSTSSDSTTDVGTAGTGQPAPTVTGDETSVSDGSTVTTVVMTSEGFTTGVIEPTVCEAMCETAAACRLVEDAGSCVALCNDKFEGADEVCEAAQAAMLGCFAGLTCEQLALALEEELGHPCSKEQIDAEDACLGPLDCDSGGGGDINGSMCELELNCPGDPLREMKCDTEQCLCFVGEEQVGSCPAEGVCDSFDGLGDKGVSCCDFPPFSF